MPELKPLARHRDVGVDEGALVSRPKRPKHKVHITHDMARGPCVLSRRCLRCPCAFVSSKCWCCGVRREAAEVRHACLGCGLCGVRDGLSRLPRSWRCGESAPPVHGPQRRWESEPVHRRVSGSPRGSRTNGPFVQLRLRFCRCLPVEWNQGSPLSLRGRVSGKVERTVLSCGLGRGGSGGLES